MTTTTKRARRRIEPKAFTPEQEDLLVELFMGIFQPADRRNNPRMAKSKTLFQLAHAAAGGAILELGTYYGNGSISLAWGAAAGGKCPVHTVDPFVKTTGWQGEPYEPEDYDVFLANVKRAGVKVTHWRMKSMELVAQWREPVALLYWDSGGVGPAATIKALAYDFAAWSPHIMPGGVYAVHEPGQHQFQGDKVIARAEAAGLWEPAVQWGGNVWSMKRKAEK